MDWLRQFGNDRELATLAWIVVGCVALVVFRKARKEITPTLKILFGSSLIVLVAVFGAWLVAALWLAQSIGFWTRGELWTTVLWFVFNGTVWFGTFAKAGKQPHFVRRRLVESIGATAFVEALANARTFSLWVELLILPLLAFVAMLHAVAQSKPEHRQVATFLEWVLGAAGVVFVVQSVVGFVTNLGANEIAGMSRSIAVPIWLSVASAPFIYVLGVYSVYEVLGNRLNHGGKAGWRVRLGLMSALRLRLEDVTHIPLFVLRQAVEEGTLRAGRAAVARFRADRAADLAARTAASKRLADNAGLKGVDDEGRRLDRREFEVTKDSLDYLANCLLGHYRNLGYFRSDMLELIDNFEIQGLSDPHGIALIVRNDMQAWLAYRRTVTGWVFAVGAVDTPDNIWRYDGEDPPAGFPAKPLWSDMWDETRLEWRDEDPTLADDR